ncbi:hypothetical protein Hanom_Chr10g00873591 [Helianthus anomalus]
MTEKYGSAVSCSMRLSSPGTTTLIETSRLLLLLKASATRFEIPDLCFTTKVNFSKKAIHRACLCDTLS